MEALLDQGEAALGLQGFLTVGQYVVELVNALPEYGIDELRVVYRGTDQACAEPVGFQVEDSFAEAGGVDRSAVVGDVGRQQRDLGLGEAVFAVVQVVTDDAFVDDQDGPGVVGMARVGVGGEVGVQYLDDTAHLGSPGLDLRTATHG